jgi:GNAT superfamily N-acetyltransferase
MDIDIRTLQRQDIPEITAAFTGSEWRIAPSFFDGFLAEQDNGQRVILLAYVDNAFTGYVTIKWKSDYPPFNAKGIPEISDLRVFRAFRRRGIATALVDEAEKRCFERSPVVGIGVGMYADYGPAQRMYVLRGYVPDGMGLYHKNNPVVPGQYVCVDDDLNLYFIKERKQDDSQE